MQGILVYRPAGKTAEAADFIEALEPKLRNKVVWQLFRLSRTPQPMWKEPHYKHFTIEKYSALYELREKGRIAIRIIFTVCPSGEILLLHAFIKRQRRDTMRALDQSLRILAALREHPEHAVEYKIKEEEPK